ncbi:IclR family transcriptional regulator [Microbacterium murale]|uniref:DNA-binding IclR family transcriptional regulator n=1 Tax=Microbacterium murale TaxID=1081040 RepID=A0ABU0P8P8_9MICO|nr:IclR family transcriptional regulator [Microbacterium murale]MDQ0643282.1 DNA-binding IclR family transcriptional regulator [Microbacterium murale]
MSDGVLDRALLVLGCFHEDAPDLTAAQLAECTGLAVSTLHRLLATMIERGLLVRLPPHRYAVGARLWELGELSPLSLRLRETALPHMMRLYEATGENVHLAVLDGPDPASSDALFVGRVTGRSSIPTVSRMGSREPLHTTGVGKALLSTRDDVWLEQYFHRKLEAETTLSITAEAALRADIELARVRGFATTREEMTLGNVSVAAALGRVDDLPPVAIGVVVRLQRADERRLAPLVIQAAKDLRDELSITQ